MEHINDLIVETLIKEGFGLAGDSYSDVMVAWLKAVIVSPTKGVDHVNDLFMAYMWELGITDKHYNDRLLKFYQLGGATSEDITDAQYQYWTNRNNLP